MRAAVLTHHGDLDALAVVDNLPVPEPGSGEVRVAVKAAALNRLDLWVREGWRGLNLEMPHILCADGAGVVDAVGPGVTGFEPGDRICINPTVIERGAPPSMGEYENQTRHMHILGETVPGVAAQYRSLPAHNLLKMPDHITYEAAAAAGLVYVTAWHSLITRGGLQAGETVLIVGAGGGVNTASIQIAKLAGATVYVVGSTAFKCAKARELGADVTINREEEENWSKVMYKLTDKQGVDVVVDNVGQATLPDSIRSTRIGGRILIVGNTSGPHVEIDIRQIFARQISIIGSTMGPHRDFVRVMNHVFDGSLKPVVGESMGVDDIREAQRRLQDFEVFGKVVLNIDD